MLKYNDFLKFNILIENSNIQNKLNPIKLNPINEGGAFGHLMHPFDNLDLTFNDFKELINITANGAFTLDNVVTEKCLHESTLLSLYKNGVKTIKEIVDNKIKDKILSYNFDANEVIYSDILNWVKNISSFEWLEIITTDNKKIKCTPNHRIYSNNKDIKAETLKIGDPLIVYQNSDNGKGYVIKTVKKINKILENNDCYDITVSDFSHYFANGILVHNTDGQNLMVSWKNGKLICARNKGHIKKFGENAIDINGLQTMFKDRGNIEIAFVSAMKDLTNALTKLSDKEKLEFFNEGQKFLSIEIITPLTQNVIPYGQNLLVFHGINEYDENGNILNYDNTGGKKIASIIEKINANIQEKFYIKSPPTLEIKPFSNIKQRESYYIKKLNDIMSEGNARDFDTIYMYIINMAILKLDESLNKDGYIIEDIKVKEKLVQRLLKLNKDYVIKDIKKELGSIATWFINFENKEKYFKKNIFLPLEKLFLELGTEVMKNVSSFLSANPTEASQEMKKEIEGAIEKIKKTGSEDQIEKLNIELDRLSAVGTLDDIVPSEGITFVYKGNLYKYTGLFAILNQIRGILVYGR